MKFFLTRASWLVKEPYQPCDGWGISCDEHGFWTVDINTLDDLVKFIQEQGECVVDVYNGIPSLRIYDYYIE